MACRPLLAHRVILLLALASLACALAACAPYGAYTVPKTQYDMLSAEEQRETRLSMRPCTDLTADASDTELSEACTLSIIEFDDQGEFWYPEQLDDTLHLIERSSTRDADGKPKDAALVVVFVHGWKNNASLDNELTKNLAGFKQVLLQLAEQELRRGEADRRQVIGVYMSWHGLSLTGKLLKQLTFFSRKNAATRVARVSFSHAIQRIVARTKGTLVGCSEDAADDQDDLADGPRVCTGNPNSIAVVVGHSFGGLIVENTLLRTLTVETNDFEAYGADLTVLVNPANEAVLARQSVEALQGAPAKQRKIDGRNVAAPLIVSVTSVTDNATNATFRLGMSVKGLFKKFRTYEDHEPGRKEQRYYYVHTPGHSCEYDDKTCETAALYSHIVTCPQKPGGVCEKLDESVDVMAKIREMSAQQKPGETIFPPPAVELGDCIRGTDQRHGLACIDRLSFYGAATSQMYSVARDATSHNQTGYWIMPIPSSIVGGHSDIFQSELASLLAAFINLRLAQVVETLDEADAYMQELFPD